jgi:predicted enzyme related to lactoylglutathione lyase
MPTVDPDGTPCRPELLAPDPAAAQAFYEAVFDWQFKAHGDSVSCLSGGTAVASIARSPASGDDDPASARAVWRIYLAAADPAATADAMRRHGATVLDAPEAGPDGAVRALLADPAGMTVGVRDSGAPLPPDLPGSLAYATLTTRDAPLADGFYRAVFGYAQRLAPGDLGKAGVQLWALDGRDRCGRVAMGPEYPQDVEPHWTGYLTVTDAAAAAERISAAGGKVVVPPFDASQGRFVVAIDPGGAPFGLIARHAGS